MYEYVLTRLKGLLILLFAFLADDSEDDALPLGSYRVCKLCWVL